MTPNADRPLLDDLGSAVGSDQLVTDPDVMESLYHDDAEWAPWQLPAAVVRAESAADIQAVVVQTPARRS